ncbi:MAG: multicopper oxidase domain-containing protein, partial [Ignavibacteriales bacterium]|nr:multicopper oxidase domain-containing protein [Ignavibacteriales bacterium]
MNRYRTNRLMVISLFYLLITGIDSISAQSQLAIPDTLSGSNISLTIQNGVKTFYPGYITQTIGINGNILGPTLILHKGETVRMLVRNSLLDTTTIHWHGLHVPAETDGGPHTVILPVSFWQPQFSIKDKAAMYWYHPHAHGKTAEQVTKGAAGLIIVRDEEESLLPLPRTYGVDDLPIVVQSRAFDVNKQFIAKSELDSVILVNGDINTFANVPAQIVRLRLLNGSTERTYNFGFSGDIQFYQIGGDGGLLDKPVIRTRLRLAPGERAEILVDFGTMQGQTTRLMSYASELPAGIIGASLPGSMGGTLPGYSSNKLNGSDFVILKLEIVNPTPNAITQMPSTLTLNIPWNISQVNATRTFTFTSVGGMMNITGPFLINGASFNMNFINFTTKLNNIEIWTLRNNTGIAHPFHLHGVQFYLLDRNGTAVAAGERGRKDNVLVLPNDTVR